MELKIHFLVTVKYFFMHRQACYFIVFGSLNTRKLCWYKVMVFQTIENHYHIMSSITISHVVCVTQNCDEKLLFFLYQSSCHDSSVTVNSKFYKRLDFWHENSLANGHQGSNDRMLKKIDNQPSNIESMLIRYQQRY